MRKSLEKTQKTKPKTQGSEERKGKASLAPLCNAAVRQYNKYSEGCCANVLNYLLQK